MKKLFMCMIISIAMIVSSATADIITNSFGDFVSNQANGWGTTFTPGIGTIDPAITLPQTLYLTEWTFAKTSSGGGTTAGDVYLVIFSELDPYAMDETNIIGTSTTTVDMAAATNGSQVTWQFANIALDKDTQYALMFSSTPDHTGILMSQGLELEVGNPYTGGGFIRVNNTANDWDPDYLAKYSTGTEPALVSPANGATLVNVEQNVAWSAPPTGTTTGYNVYYSSIADPNIGEDFTSINVESNVLAADLNPAGNLEFNTVYSWYVESIQGTKISASPVWTFTTAPATPVVTVDPSPATIPQGQSYTFTVDGLNQTSYQWLKNGAEIDGATEQNLIISDATIDDEGFYSCLLINDTKPLGQESASAGLWIQRLVAQWTFEDDSLVDISGNSWDGIPMKHDPNTADNVDYPADITYGPGLKENSRAMLLNTRLGTTEEPGEFFAAQVKIPDSGTYFNFVPQGLTAVIWFKEIGTVYNNNTTLISKHTYGIADDPETAIDETIVRSGWAMNTSRANGFAPWSIFRGSNYPQPYSGYAVNDDQWHMAVLTSEPGQETNPDTGITTPIITNSIYVDGVARNTVTGYNPVLIQNPLDLIIGNDEHTPSYGGLAIAAYDEVRIYNYALDYVTIAQEYANVTDTTVCTGPVEFDINGDCIVNLGDFAIFVSEWMLSGWVAPQ
ncbi:MAG: immunoglobulin domain-containing protein [Phycisphaerae bacterium]|nr:immunoglobulin domain-containing protein [Phycisphaerae bacterium]